MTHAPHDPFANSPRRESDSNAPESDHDLTPPPGVLQPGMLESAGVPMVAPPPMGAADATWRPEAPKRLAQLVVIATGVFTLGSLLGVFAVQGQIDTLKQTLEDGTAGTPSFNAGMMLTLLGGPLSFVALAMWMSRIRANLAATGVRTGGPRAVEWWGWFVPLANYVLPYLGMRAIARRSVSTALLLAWWIPFALWWALWGLSQVVSFSAIDLATGQLANDSALDALYPISVAQGILIVTSWAFLTMIVRRTTARHLAG